MCVIVNLQNTPIMTTFGKFRLLSFDSRINTLMEEAVSLDLFITGRYTEVALFAMHDYYVELHVKRYTDIILAVKAFRSVKKLDAYLPQVDIEEIKCLLAG